MPLVLDETNSIVLLARSEQPENWISYTNKILIHERENETIELVRSRSREAVSGGIYMTIPFSGTFLWEMADINKIVYTNTEIDKINEENGSNYIIHVMNLDNMNITKIKQQYEQVEIPQEIKNKNFFIQSNSDTPVYMFGKKLAQEAKFFAPLQILRTDGNYAFAFTFKQNEKSEHLVDVFNIEKGSYVISAYFSILPNVIKNGYAYLLKKGNDIFPVVEKYKIDPAVYGK
ncbi:hypothetical protein IIB79_09210 [candidate division KSB1 bacterium]|nr:hypothetical protein [candidate division KSB1 bacterium]